MGSMSPGCGRGARRLDRVGIGALRGLGLAACLVLATHAQTLTPRPGTTPEEAPVTRRASGAFDVKLAPLPTYAADDSTRGRMSLDKEFRGDLQGTSKGEMLTAMGSVKGSAGYVAIERVSGTLHGRRGSFVLQHDGTMNRGAPSLTIRIVPDSGTEQLAGIFGTMTIEIAEGKHSYALDYTLPAAP